MKKTIADMFREEGAVECLRSTLLELLEERFGEVPEEVTARVETSKSLKQLRTWMRRFATAKALADVQIPPLKGPAGASRT